MAGFPDHVCIKQPCEFCAITGGVEEAPVAGAPLLRLVQFRPRTAPAWERRIVAKLAQLQPAQLAAVELLIDLYLP